MTSKYKPSKSLKITFPFLALLIQACGGGSGGGNAGGVGSGVENAGGEGTDGENAGGEGTGGGNAGGEGAGGDSSTGNNDTSKQISNFAVDGHVIKGPLSNAIVFADYDGDGVLDDNEPFTRTAEDGSFSLVTSQESAIVAVTDEETIDTLTDQAIVEGFTLKAPIGFSVVSPATTLATYGLSDDQIKSLLNLPVDIDLASFNPFEEGVDPSQALAYEKAALTVFSTITALTTVTLGSGVSLADAQNTAFSTLVSTVQEKINEGGSFSFRSTDSIVLLLNNYFEAFSEDISQDTVELLKDQLVDAIVNVNDAIDALQDLDSEGSLLVIELAMETLSNQVLSATESATAGEIPTITLSDVETINEALLAVNLNPTLSIEVVSNGIDENQIDPLVANLIASDPENTEITLTLTGIGRDDAAFKIIDNQLYYDGTPDYEAQSSYRVQVQATDAAGKSVIKNIEFDINDVAESVSGAVVDGYVAGATIFQDINNNGVLDPDEPFTVTSSTGEFTLPGVVALSTAPLKMISGFDIGTNEPIITTLGAPSTGSGSIVASPLGSIASVLQAENPDVGLATTLDRVATFMGISAESQASLDILNDDALSKLLSVDETVSLAAKEVFQVNQLAMAYAHTTEALGGFLANYLDAEIQAALAKESESLPALAGRSEADFQKMSADSLLEIIAHNIKSPISNSNNSFVLQSDDVTWTDYNVAQQQEVNQSYGLVVNSSQASLNETAYLNLTNLQNILDGDLSYMPMLSLPLINIPDGSGSGTFTFTLTDGSDGVISNGEKQISLTVEAEWVGDGRDAQIILPEQTITASIVSATGLGLSLTVENADADVLALVNHRAQMPASLDLKLASLLEKLPGIDLQDFLVNGNYHLAIETDLPIESSDGQDISGFSTNIVLSDDIPLHLSIADSEVFEGDANPTVVVSLNQSAAEDIVVDYEIYLASGDSASADDVTLGTGQVTILAGLTSETIDLSLVEDINIEGQETVSIRILGNTAGIVTRDEADITIHDSSNSITNQDTLDSILDDVLEEVLDEISTQLASNYSQLNTSGVDIDAIISSSMAEITPALSAIYKVLIDVARQEITSVTNTLDPETYARNLMTANAATKSFDPLIFIGTEINVDGTYPQGKDASTLLQAVSDQYQLYIDLSKETIGDIFGSDNASNFANASIKIFTDGDDNETTSDASEIIATFDGVDTIYAGGGHDKILGGVDKDSLFGQSGDDHLYGYRGDDYLDGGTGDNRIVGGLGNDTIIGGDGDDYILAQTGNDIIYTGAGSDFVLAGLGDDSVTVDGNPGVGFYGNDIGGPIFNQTSYFWHENSNGHDSIKLDITDPDYDPITQVEVIGGDDSDEVWSSSTGIYLDWGSRDFEDPRDANADGVYEFTVRAYTGDGSYTDSAISITLVDDGKPTNQEWDYRNGELFSDSTITYVIGQEGQQIPLTYRGMNIDDGNASLSGEDADLFRVDWGAINFRDEPTSASQLMDADRDGIFEFTLSTTDYSGNAFAQDFAISLVDNKSTIDGMLVDGGLGDDTLSLSYDALSSTNDIETLLYSNGSSPTQSGGQFILVDQSGGILSFRNFEDVSINAQTFDINYGEINYQLKSVLYSSADKTALMYSHRQDSNGDLIDNTGTSRLDVSVLQSQYHNGLATDLTIIGSSQRDEINASSYYNESTAKFTLGTLSISTEDGDDQVDVRGGLAHSVDLGAGDDNVKLYLDDVLTGYLSTKSLLVGGSGSDTLDFSSSGGGYFNATVPTLSQLHFEYPENLAFNTWEFLMLGQYVIDDNLDNGMRFDLIGGADQAHFGLYSDGDLYFHRAWDVDYEDPFDMDMDNNYELRISVSDERGHVSEFDITVGVTDQDDSIVAPTLTDTRIELKEITNWNGTVVALPLIGDDSTTIEISGTDAGMFSNNEYELEFNNWVDYESPQDSDGDNIYEITLTYMQWDSVIGGYQEIGSQDIEVAVTDDPNEGLYQGITYTVNEGVAEGFENIIGTGYTDILTGDSADNILSGNTGDDTLYGLEGDDRLIGDDVSSEDWYWEEGSDELNHDTLYGGDGNDVLLGDQGQDTLYGDAGNDSLYGGSGDDILVGGAGKDTLYGDMGESNYSYYGEDSSNFGYDLFIIDAENATTDISQADIIADFQDTYDTIAIGENITVDAISVRDDITGFEGSSVISYEKDGQTYYLGVVQGVAASQLNFLDFALSSTDPLTLQGDTSVDDIILGGFGNDTVTGIDGRDIVLTSRGDDSVTVDGNPGVGFYGNDIGGPIFNQTSYFWHENSNGHDSIKLDITDPDYDPITQVEVIGGDDSDEVWSSSTGIYLDWGSRDFEDPRDANADGVYEFTVRAYTGDGSYTDSAISITLVDDGKPTNQEWDYRNGELFSDSTITYVIGQEGQQIPLTYRGMNIDDGNASLSGEDADLFRVDWGAINFRDEPTSASQLMDADRDGIFEFTLSTTDYSGNAFAQDFAISLVDNKSTIDGMLVDGGLGDDTLSLSYDALSSTNDIETLLYSNGSSPTQSGGQFILVDQSGGILSFRNFEDVSINAQTFDINYGEINYQLKSVLYSSADKTALMYSHRQDSNGDLIDNTGTSRLDVSVLQSQYHNGLATDLTIIGSSQRDEINASSYYNESTAKFTLGTLSISTEDGDDQVDVRGGLAHSVDLGAGDDNVKLYLDDVLTGYLSTKSLLVGGSGSDTLDFSSSGGGYFNATVPTLSQLHFEYPENLAFNTWEFLMLGQYVIDDNLDNGMRFDLIGGADQAHFGLYSDGDLYFHRAWDVDYEDPFDMDMDNNYELRISVSDERGHVSEFDITVGVTDQDDSIVAPTLTDTRIELKEITNWNGTVVALPLIGDDSTTIEISGTDAGMFSNNEYELEFNNWVDYESPQDSDGDNIYEITLTYMQWDSVIGGYQEIGSQDIEVAVTDDPNEGLYQGITYTVNEGVAEGFENIIGTGYTDILTGDSADNILSGNTGDDTLYGLEGDDRLIGDDVSSEDWYWEEGSDELNHDTLYGGDGNDVLLGDQGQDTLYGDAGNDSLYGGSGDDILVGGAGKDTLYGDMGESNYSYYGEDSSNFGYDLFIIDAENATTDISQADIIADFQDTYDTIAIGENITVDAISVRDDITGFEGSSVISYEKDGQTYYLGVVQGVAASQLNFLDFALSSTDPLTLQGDTSVDDIILGGFGNDTVTGIDGRDIVLTSRGDDSVTVDGNPGVGFYGNDIGGPIFNQTSYFWHENSNGHDSIKLDITDPDYDPITQVEVIGGDDSDEVWSSSTGIYLDWGSRDFEDPRDANADGVYEFTVRAYTGDGSYTDSAISITLVDDGKPTNQEWDYRNGELFSDSTITYVIGQEGQQIPLTYRGMNIDDGNASLSGEDADLFRVDWGAINFRDEPTSASQLMDADRDGIFEFTLSTTDYSGNAFAQDFAISLVDNKSTIDGMLVDGGLGDDTLSLSYDALSSTNDIETLLYSNGSSPTQSGGQFILVDQSGGILSFRNFEDVSINAQTFDINYGEINYQLKSVLYSSADKTALMYSHRQDSNGDLIDNTGTSRLDVSVLQSQYHNGLATDLTIIGSSQRDEINASSYYNESTAKFTLGTLSISTEDGDDQVDVRGGLAHSVDLGAGDDNVKLYLDDVLTGYLSTKSLLVGGSGSDTLDFSSSGGGYFNATVPTLSQLHFEYPENLAFNTWEFLMLGQYVIDDNLDNGMRFDLIGGADQAHFGLYSDGDLYFHRAWDVDYEDPFDMDMDNNYELRISVSDERGHVSEFDITVGVTDQDDSIVAPTLTDTRIELKEITNWNGTVVALPLIGDDSTTIEISGTDAGMFSNNEYELEFNNWVDYESPQDSDGDNIYEITLTYMQWDSVIGGYQEIGSQDIEVAVTDDPNEGLYQGITYTVNEGVAEGFENIIGTGYTDILTGDSADNILSGNTGDDTLYGLEGDDRLIGDDVSSEDWYWEEGSDELNHDTLYGGDGNDVLLGDQGQDTLYGDAGNDSLYGGSGDDILVGGAGKDTLYGDMGESNYSYYGEDSSNFGYDMFSFSRQHAVDNVADADIIVDFQDGYDYLGGVDFEFTDLAIQAYGSNSSVVMVDGKYLVILEGIGINEFDEADFTPIDTL